jgi:hypothetical protein
MPTRRSFVIAALLLAFAPMASAQQPGQTPAERAALVRDAFASDYGKALTAELGKSLRKDADPACLKAKGLEADQLEARGRDLLVNWGTNFAESTAAFLDMKAFAENFPASAELEQLKQDPDVKQYLAISEPARQATLLDMIVENFSRYVLINRIKLAQLAPLATGNQELLSKNPTDAVQDALDKFVESRKSAALDRFLDLSDQAVEVFKGSIRKDEAVALGGPHAFFKGVEADLAELCIGKR